MYSVNGACHLFARPILLTRSSARRLYSGPSPGTRGGFRRYKIVAVIYFWTLAELGLKCTSRPASGAWAWDELATRSKARGRGPGVGVTGAWVGWSKGVGVCAPTRYWLEPNPRPPASLLRHSSPAPAPIGSVSPTPTPSFRTQGVSREFQLPLPDIQLKN